MAALQNSSCASKLSDKSCLQPVELIRAVPGDNMFSDIDLEKGLCLDPASNAAYGSAPRLRSWTLIGSFFLRPCEWNRTKRQVAEDRRKKQLDDSEVKSNHAAREDYPKGWPQLAALMNRRDGFAVYRKFGYLHSRLLVQLQAEIQHLEQRLRDLDRSDALPNSPHTWRLHMSDFKDGIDSAQRDLLNTLQKKLLDYHLLLLNKKELDLLPTVPEKDHRSLFDWMTQNKPLAPDEASWINHRADCIQVPGIGRVERSVFNSFLEKLLQSMISKLFFILLADSVLLVPVFILMWGPNTKAAIATTVLISVSLFSILMTLFTKANTIQTVLVGTAAYCAVLATFMGNTHGRSSTTTE